MSVSLLSFSFPGVPGVKCAFQMRSCASEENPMSGGNISFDVGDDPDIVRENRAEFMARMGVDSWAELKQVHGDALVFDPSAVGPEGGIYPAADGSATSIPGRPLLIKTADCQPILVAHRSGKYVLAMHAGWRGDRIGFPTSGVERFCEHYGIEPADCVAVRGPSLGPDKAEFVNFDKEWGEGYDSYFAPDTRTMDLWGLTRDLLVAAGIPARSVHGVDLCTYTNAHLFWSYRRNRTCGRQASLIWIAPESSGAKG